MLHIKRFHEGNEKVKCDICGKEFSTAYNLRIHVKNVHKGHKDYKCNSCNKAFTQKGTLDAHTYKKCTRNSMKLQM